MLHVKWTKRRMKSSMKESDFQESKLPCHKFKKCVKYKRVTTIFYYFVMLKRLNIVIISFVYIKEGKLHVRFDAENMHFDS